MSASLQDRKAVPNASAQKPVAEPNAEPLALHALPALLDGGSFSNELGSAAVDAGNVDAGDAAFTSGDADIPVE